MKTIETKVYSFDELSDDAKEKAREWCRETLDFSFHQETPIEDAKECAALIGIDIDKVYYSGFSSQGDGACFEGNYQYKKGALKAIMQHAPEDKQLHKIAKGLQDIQRKHFYQVYASVSHSGHYYHQYCTRISVELQDNSSVSNATEETVKELLRDFMAWIYSQLEKEYDYQNSNEAIDETINANEYTFTENVKRFG